MPNPSVPPAQQTSDKQNPPPHNGASHPGQALQQHIAQALQPTLAQLQAHMTRTVEQQLEPLRSHLQNLAQQQLTAPLSATLQQQAQTAPPAQPGNEQASAPQQEPASAVDHAPSDRETVPAAQDEAASREVAAPAEQAAPSTLQQWGENLEAAALMVLALGAVLEGVALLLQAVAYLRQRGTATQEAQIEATSPEREQEAGKARNAAEHGPSALKELSGAVASSVSSLTHLLSRNKEKEEPAQKGPKDQEGEDEPEEPDEGGPSFLGKISEAASQGVSSLKDALSHVTGDGSSPDGARALQQWSDILEHASTLVQALGDAASEQRKGQGGLASMGKWLKVYRRAHSLADELKQTFGHREASYYRGQGEPGVFSKAEHLLGKLTSSDDKEKDEEKESSGEKHSEKHGGVSSALKSLAGRSSTNKSEKGEGEDGGLLDALTGEDSPLQALREFSKRQQGPGGLAPKGPIGRKPPPGPLRRDRLPGAKS